MGYYTTLNGTLYLSGEPSLEVWEKITDLNALYFLASDSTDTVIEYDFIDGKFYGLEDDINSLVGILGQVGISVKGVIECVGEEQPDIWRLVVKDGSVIREGVRMVWPDGSEYR